MFAAAGRFELMMSGSSFPGYRSPFDEHGEGSQEQAHGDDFRAARRLINQWLNDIPLGYAAPQGQPEVLGGRQRFILCLAIETGVLSASTPVTMAEYIRQGHQSKLVPKILDAVRSIEMLETACNAAKQRASFSDPHLERDSNVADAFKSFCTALNSHLSSFYCPEARAKAQLGLIITDIRGVLGTYYGISDISEQLTEAAENLASIAVRELSSRERRNVSRRTTEVLKSLMQKHPDLQSAYESLARYFNPVSIEYYEPPGWNNARDDAERRALLLDAAESEMRQRLLGVLGRQFPESSQVKRTQTPDLKALLRELASVGVVERTPS